MKVICIDHAPSDQWIIRPDINEVCEVVEVHYDAESSFQQTAVYGIRIKSRKNTTVYYPINCFNTISEYRDIKIDSILS